jgi:hypothetical protein
VTPDARLRLAPLGLAALLVAAVATSAAATPPTLVVTATATGFTVAPNAPAGTLIITLTNRAGRVMSAQLLAVLQNHTALEAIASLTSTGRRPDWVVAAGGVGPLAHGRSASVEERLTPGEYVLLSTLADSDGTAQYRRGYIAGFRATGAVKVDERAAYVAAVGTLSAGAAFRFQRVAMRDGRRFELYGRQRGTAVSPGERVIEVTTAGAYAHEVMVVRMDESVLVRRWSDWLAGGQRGPAPGVAVGGSGVIPQGRTFWLRVMLEPGTYWLLCTLPHREGLHGFQTGEYAQFVVR